ncbi:unnamed protein product (macronuclear) [Paramecium tetraurelia]|uniref:Transmembrane protein n=1 Tax=Paramecium tetraurelia TaxID=5888 RepID=A0BEZ7_PARTE|nr:uncharacterized protein GSPATT00028149001 [Paramecium tetraurelia]CAK57114.1 unnamed protein product [Paramecium tetraurelia]|eukprot:XP_001424512.1 hypothetical protein (macronuclear) [Paramecium tetraurelia strain d4-2]
MNNFTLKFNNPELELQYQEEKIQKIRKRVFYLFMALGLILNISKVILDIVEFKPFTKYINYTLIGIIIVLVPVSIKWPIHIRYTLMVANISTALLQMNFTDTTSPQMYYSYGSNFTQFQTCAYFVSDFLDSVVQVICHTLIKSSITIYQTESVDPQDILMSVGAAIIISMVIYISDSHSRKEFLQNVCENIWCQQLPEIIKKPYFQITYNKNLLQYNVLSWNEVERFPSYCDQMCQGCNVRSFLRMYKSDDKELGYQLQELITGTINVHNGKYKFKIRIINIGVDYTHKIIILDNTLTQNTDLTLMMSIKKSMSFYIKQSSNKSCQVFFNWGMMSLLLINDFTIQEIQLYKLIKKLNAIYQKQKQFDFFVKGDQTIVFTGYINLIRIYMIQVYQILTQIYEHQEKKRKRHSENKPIPIFLSIYKETDTICIQLPPTLNYLLFICKYTKNIFISQIEQTILAGPIQNDLKINFNTCVPYKKI